MTKEKLINAIEDQYKEINQLPVIQNSLNERYEDVKNEFCSRFIRKFKADDIDAVMQIWLKS